MLHWFQVMFCLPQQDYRTPLTSKLALFRPRVILTKPRVAVTTSRGLCLAMAMSVDATTSSSCIPANRVLMAETRTNQVAVLWTRGNLLTLASLLLHVSTHWCIWFYTAPVQHMVYFTSRTGPQPARGGEPRSLIGQLFGHAICPVT